MSPHVACEATGRNARNADETGASRVIASRLNVPRGATFEDCVADGSVIAGPPQRVRDEIERQVGELGVNYLLTYLFLGTMTLDEALRSLELFASEVMPRLAQL